LPPVDLLSRVFVGIFDAVDLVAQAIGFIEKGWRVSAHNLEMLSVAGQELLPIRNICHAPHTLLPQRSAERDASSGMCSSQRPDSPPPAEGAKGLAPEGIDQIPSRNLKMGLSLAFLYH